MNLLLICKNSKDAKIFSKALEKNNKFIPFIKNTIED